MSSSFQGAEAEQPLYDVLIVGSGPAGTTAGIYAARARLKAVMVDKATLGGALGITGRIANYPGFGFERPTTGAELLTLMHQHASSLGVKFVQSQVYGLSLEGETKEAYTADGVYRAKTVIIATGAGSRENKIPGEEQFLGRGVSYCATCDAAFYGGKTVAVVGNSAEAVEEAEVLAKFASKVYLFNPASKFFADPHDVEHLSSMAPVEIRNRLRAIAIEGQATVQGLRLVGPEGEVTYPVDGVFVYLPGNKPATDFLLGMVELSEEGFIVTDKETRTSVEGVFAAGDVRGNDLQQVVIACADGCVSALAADRYINKRARSLSQR